MVALMPALPDVEGGNVDRQRHAAFQAVGDQGALDGAVAGAAGHCNGMAGGGELARRAALTYGRVVAPLRRVSRA